MANRNRGRVSVEVDTFVGRLNRLFAVVYPPGRGPYRNFEVTQALAGRGSVLSAPYLSQLRRGLRSRPSARTVEMLAVFFGVQAEYFNTSSCYARAVDAELDWLELARDPSVHELTTGLMALDPAARDELLRQATDVAAPSQTAIPMTRFTGTANGMSHGVIRQSTDAAVQS